MKLFQVDISRDWSDCKLQSNTLSLIYPLDKETFLGLENRLTTEQN